MRAYHDVNQALYHDTEQDAGLGEVLVFKSNRFRWFNMSTGQRIRVNTLSHVPTILHPQTRLFILHWDLQTGVFHKCKKCTVTLCLAVRSGLHLNFCAMWHIVKCIYNALERKDGSCGADETSDDSDVVDSDDESVSKLSKQTPVVALNCEHDSLAYREDMDAMYRLMIDNIN